MKLGEYTSRPQLGEWLIEPIIGLGHNVLIYGKRSAGKSLFAWEIARAVARGAKLFGQFQAALGRVLIIDEETAEFDFDDRIKQSFFGSQALRDNIETWPRPEDRGFRFDSVTWRQGLQSKIGGMKPRLVIIDNLNATEGKMHFEASNSQVGELRRILTELRQDNSELVFAIIHHEGRGKGPRGAIALEDMSDTELSVSRVWDSPFRFVVTQIPRKRGVGTRPFVIERRVVRNKSGLKFLGFEEHVELPRLSEILLAEHFVICVPRDEAKGTHETRSIEELVKEMDGDLGITNIRKASHKLWEQKFLSRGRFAAGLHQYEWNPNWPRSQYNRALEGVLHDRGTWADYAEAVFAQATQNMAHK